MGHVVNATHPQWSVYVQRLSESGTILHIGASPGHESRHGLGLVLADDEAAQVARMLAGDESRRIVVFSESLEPGDLS